MATMNVVLLVRSVYSHVYLCEEESVDYLRIFDRTRTEAMPQGLRKAGERVELGVAGETGQRGMMTTASAAISWFCSFGTMFLEIG